MSRGEIKILLCDFDHDISKYENKCGMIKQNESEFANIDLEIEPNKGNKSFFVLLF